MENNYKVYVHMFPNDQAYVGITKQEVIARWGKNGSGYKKQPVYEAITEFGWDNIKHYVLYDGLTIDEAKQKEKELIEQLDSVEFGYNISQGGDVGGIPICQYEYNGELLTAEEIAKLSEDGITAHDITTRINHRGWDIQRAMTQKKHEKGKRYYYNGGYYTTSELLQFSKIEDMTVQELIGRLKKWDGDVERALTQPKSVKIQPFTNKYIYNGKTYNIQELYNLNTVYGLTLQNFTQRLDSGWDIERALTQPLKSRDIKVEYKGEYYTFKELAEISEIDDITPSIIRERVTRMNWSVEKAISTPKLQH